MRRDDIIAGHPEDATRILVVDDEPYICELVRRWLNVEGYACDTATCAAEAWDRLGENTYQLVISDITMPGEDGLELLRRVRDRYGDAIAVIMATALSDRELVTRALRLGAYGYTVKPLEHAELAIHVAAALERRRLTLRSLAWQEQLEEEVRRRTADVSHREQEIAWRLICAADSRDAITGAHNQRIGIYARALAQANGWQGAPLDDIVLAAAMHDIGKIGVPDAILQKPGPLSTEERAIMQLHTTQGAEILRGSSVPLLQMAATIARSHHERWDGAGYPDGLAGHRIPEAARIVAIVDVYDALRSDRPYRGKLSLDASLKEMRAMRDGHFDPRLYRRFEDILDELLRLEGERQPLSKAG